MLKVISASNAKHFQVFDIKFEMHDSQVSFWDLLLTNWLQRQRPTATMTQRALGL